MCRGAKWWESEQGLKGKEEGKMRETGWEDRGPKADSKNSDFGTPLMLFSGLPRADSQGKLAGRNSVGMAVEDPPPEPAVCLWLPLAAINLGKGGEGG